MRYLNEALPGFSNFASIANLTILETFKEMCVYKTIRCKWFYVLLWFLVECA